MTGEASRDTNDAGIEPISLAESLERVVRSLRPVDAAAGVVQPSVAVIGGVFGRWDDAVGPAISAHARPVRLDGTHLLIEVDEPAWATQIRFYQDTVRRRLAEVAGATVETIDVRVRRR